MHGDTILLMTFVLALVAAFAGGLVARALRLPPIVGYLVGGLVVGPFTPGFIGDSDAMSQLSEIGVMFMMFGTVEAIDTERPSITPAAGSQPNAMARP